MNSGNRRSSKIPSILQPYDSPEIYGRAFRVARIIRQARQRYPESARQQSREEGAPLHHRIEMTNM